MGAVAGTARCAPKGDEVADGELVRRVRRGDDGAFEALYHRYHRRITAYIHGMVHDHARAEDIAQDVFVSALRRMRDTDRPIAFKPWIYEIAKNACIDQFRRSRRTEEVSFDAEEGMGAADYGRLVSSDAMPETELESKQNLDHLRGAFGGLSETHHEILVMRELEGLSYREIGERLGMSRPSVESTLFRARRRLTEEYEELVSGTRCQRIQAIIAAAQAATPGARDQRRLARHVSHCQPCRRQARLAGLEVPAMTERPVRQRIAAFLPLPLFLRRRWSGESAETAPALAQWTQLGATMDPSWLKAAATAATVAIAGTGAGLAGSTDRSAAGLAGIGQVVPVLDRGGERSPASGARASRALVVLPGGASIDAALGAATTAGAARDRRRAGRPGGAVPGAPSSPSGGVAPALVLAGVPAPVAAPALPAAGVAPAAAPATSLATPEAPDVAAAPEPPAGPQVAVQAPAAPASAPRPPAPPEAALPADAVPAAPAVTLTGG